MGEIFSELGRLFVQTVPTVIFVFLLLILLERLFFKPLVDILQKRQEATTGALERARKDAETAGGKLKEYEAAILAVRQELYKQREADRRAALAERDDTLRKAREQAEARLKEAEAAIKKDLEAAKVELAGTVQTLSAQIAEKILGEGTASR
jgi:F-type H+-transporting ATPase subunit b